MELYIIWYTLIWLVIIWLFSLPLKILAMNYRGFKTIIKLRRWWKRKLF